MLVTEEFIKAFDVCSETAEVLRNNNLLGQEVSSVLRSLRDLGLSEPTAWWNGLDKSTEYYVRNNGSILTMGAYQVFNPLTGQHTRYETEEEARTALVEVAKEVLKQHCPTVVQELSNENGDTTWIPTTMNETLNIS